MHVKPHTGPGPNPRAVRVFRAEKGVTLPFVAIDLMGGENRRAPDGFGPFASRRNAAAGA
jgi:hypothetical protein